MTTSTQCPCGSGASLSQCCGPIIVGENAATTAEALMRSRYTAYAMRDVNYLLRTWHSSTRPLTIDSTTIPQWCRLQIIRTEAGGKNDYQGIVEFEAASQTNNRSFTLHETSNFVKEGEQWYYVDGVIQEQAQSTMNMRKVGRNETCVCGSGKKFKKCCGP